MKQFSLRLPDDLHERLKTAADHNRRSLHAEILWRLDAPTNWSVRQVDLPEVSQQLGPGERQALERHRRRRDRGDDE